MTAEKVRSEIFETGNPKIKSARVAVHFMFPVLRSRPSNNKLLASTAFHSVDMSSKFTKNSLVNLSLLDTSIPLFD